MVQLVELEEYANSDMKALTFIIVFSLEITKGNHLKDWSLGLVMRVLLTRELPKDYKEILYIKSSAG